MSSLRRNFRTWWQYPRSYGEDPDRTVSFLELFYDLVYVAIIAELGHKLASHLDVQGIKEYGFLYVIVWLAWINGTMYHEYHGNNDVRTRVFTFLQMIAVSFMAVFAHDVIAEWQASRGFATFLSIFMLLLTILWWRSGYHDEEHRPAAYPYSLMFFIITIIFFISVFSLQYIYFWAIGLILAVFLPILISPRMRIIHQKVNRERMLSHSGIERFGLFTIIVLGEVIVGVIRGLTGFERLGLEGFYVGALALGIGFSMWWLYFDMIANHLPFKDRSMSMLWMYLHLPMTMSIAGVGAILLNAIELIAEGQVSEFQPIYLIIAIISVLVTISILSTTIEIDENYQHLYGRIRMLLLVSSVVLGLLYLVDPPVTMLLLSINVIILIPIIYGISVWVTIQQDQVEEETDV